MADTLCNGCKDVKMLLWVAGGINVEMLCNQVGRIAPTDNWEETLEKILKGLSDQVEQTGGMSDMTNPDQGRLERTDTVRNKEKNQNKWRKVSRAGGRHHTKRCGDRATHRSPTSENPNNTKYGGPENKLRNE